MVKRTELIEKNFYITSVVSMCEGDATELVFNVMREFAFQFPIGEGLIKPCSGPEKICVRHAENV